MVIAAPIDARLRQGGVVLAGGSHVAKARHEIRPLAAALLVDETLWGTQGLLRVGRPITHHPLDLGIVKRDPLQSARVAWGFLPAVLASFWVGAEDLRRERMRIVASANGAREQAMK